MSVASRRPHPKYNVRIHEDLLLYIVEKACTKPLVLPGVLVVIV